jgi:translin
MKELDAIAERARAVLDTKHGVREQTLALSREIIRTSANTIRAVHRGEFAEARELLAHAQGAARRLKAAAGSHVDLYAAGYVHDCQKELAEAALTLAMVAEEPLPDVEALEIEVPAYLNGLGEAVGELRRHVLDVIRRGDMARGEAMLAAMDEIYHYLVTFDYPDALTGGLRRTTDAVRGILERTRGDVTTSLRQDQLRAAIGEAMARFQDADGTAHA